MVFLVWTVLPLFIILALALLYAHFAGNPQVAGALRGMGAVAAGLMAGAGLKLLTSLRGHVLGFVLVLLLAALSFLGVVVLHLGLHLIVLGVGGLACLLTAKALHRKRAP